MRAHSCMPTLLAVLVALLLVVVAVADDRSPLRVGIVTDVHAHDLDSPVEGKFMSHTAERLGAFVDAMNAWPADLVIQLGDFVNGWVVLGVDPGDPARIPEILAWADGIYAGFDGPRYHVIGNHDVYNLSKEQYVSITGMQRGYYSFGAGAYHFVVLDVQYSEDGSDLAHTYTGVAGAVPDGQIDWLRDDLATADRPTIVCVHQRIDVDDPRWGRPLVQNADLLRSVLSASGRVVAVFQGHDHANAHSIIDGIHYITFEALVDQHTPPSWGHVTLDPDGCTVTIEGVGDQADYVLPYPCPNG